ncbi:MAG: PrgI family protein [Candidatus Yanofskybacteria bacterium]|nr:PrgI family protein [Candidatus Yanofskybacteria bacterium]
MRFQVPQFIETETKIVGPFTLKQFLFLATGAVIIFILQYVITNFTFLIIAALPIAAASIALAFYRIDDMPLPQYLLMALSYATGAKRYQFRKDNPPPTQIHE